MQERLFGTDGVRGLANQDLSADFAMKLAYSTARTIFRDKSYAHKVIIGHDTRISSDLLQAALCAGFSSAGVNVILAGVVPTPAIAYLVQKENCDLGVVISASHNPYNYNGIKIFSRQGYKLPDELEDQIEKNLVLFDEENNRAPGPLLGRFQDCEAAGQDYLAHLRAVCPLDLTGWRIALDTANGANYRLAPQLFSDLGAELTVLSHEPDGTNINHQCGSTHLESLIRVMQQQEHDVGFAFDGDADRLMVVDREGQVLDGDIMLGILAQHMEAEGRLKDHTLVATVMSNLGLERMIKEAGMQLIRTKVGDRYVLQEMLRHGYDLGGEQSGHLIFLEKSTTGDGLLTALEMLDVAQSTKRDFCQLRQVVTIYPQVLVNVEVNSQLKGQVMADADVLAAIERAEARLGDRGRILVRPSGTEPLIRIMLEGEDHDFIGELADDIAQLVASRFSD